MSAATENAAPSGAMPPRPKQEKKLFPLGPGNERVLLSDSTNAKTPSRTQTPEKKAAGIPAVAAQSPVLARGSHLPSDYQAFIHISRYARYNEAKHRRETWPETVGRYLDFMEVHLKNTCSYTLPATLRSELESAVINLEVMPSMRALMTAGNALDKCHLAAYNCSYLPIDHPFAFDEALYVLMNGVGVGFSVESRFTEKLPAIAERFTHSSTTVVVDDSREGWARALREVLALLWTGLVPRWDTSKLRPKGARLKTFGGRASGPEPLESLFLFAVQMFQHARGRKLTPVEAHDLTCKVAEIVVVGGVRRSALISLSDLDSDSMRTAKTGPWWEENPQRALANNSAVYESKPTMGVFMQEWKALYDSGSGERGLFSRAAAREKVASLGRREPNYDFGTNPCSEIILRPYQLCNLTEVVVRASDDLPELRRKARLAAIMGTFQATLTDFSYVRDVWRNNTEAERLLGVSMTGIMDNTLTSGQQGFDKLEAALKDVRAHAADCNAAMAAELGIPRAAAVTCVKPSGTVSQLVDAASGIHPRHSAYYIRRVRGNKTDPLTSFMAASGVPCEDDVMNASTSVFSFPIKAPEGAITRDHVSAIEHLELWLQYQRHWCEHKPSATITVNEGEWMEVGSWVYKHFDEVSGVSFLPHSGTCYKQMPYESISEEQYKALAAAMPARIDYRALVEDERKASDDKILGELACTAGGCEMVDLA